MISIDCTHPELLDFIEVKNDLNRVTKANISVRISDDFMNAVKNDLMWELYFETEHEKITKTVKAKEIFHLLCKNNWDMAEPGILFWDNIKNHNLLSEDKNFEYAGTNPCFTGDMRLLTDKGYVRLDKLCGTEPIVVSYDGQKSKGKVWCNGEKDTIKLIMTNGEIITCTPDHRFMTIDGEECFAKDLKNKKIMPKVYKTILNDEFFIKLGFIQGDGQLSRLRSELHQGLEVNIGYKDGDIRYLFENDNYTIKSEREIYLQEYNEELIRLGFSKETLPYRTFPKTYFTWGLNEKANFLQGCFSANGCINSNTRISYKTTCKDFALELMTTLEDDFGITPNLTINKKHTTEFNNGEYECRESYDININKYHDILLFAQYIGFYQTYKKIKLEKLIMTKSPSVRNIKDNGKKLVYDFKEPINHWGIVEGFVAHNCAEEPLPAGGSCLLGAINLAEYAQNGRFNYGEFSKDIHKIVRGLNEVLDEGLSLHPLQIQRDTVRDYRQIGLGVMGIADMLIKMGIKYDSSKALDFCNDISFIMANESIYASALLAKEQGTYPKYSGDAILNSYFLKRNTTPDVYNLVKEYGLRNSQILTIAPTGSISTMLGVSGGIEPIFSLSYTRKTESLHGEDVYYKVYTPIVKEYIDKHGLKEEDELPNYFVTSQNINPFKRVEMQGVWQSHIDASISSTVNLPNEATVEEVESLYIHAWENGLKGMTIYRDGCKRSGVLTIDSKEENKNDDKKEIHEVSELRRGEWKSLADDTYYVKRNISTGCGKMKLFIGFSPIENAIQDIYVVKTSSGGCEKNIQTIAITMSAIFRLGGNINQIEKALSGVGACPSFVSSRVKGNELSKGNYCGMAILNEIKSFLNELNSGNNKQEKKENKQINLLDKMNEHTCNGDCSKCKRKCSEFDHSKIKNSLPKSISVCKLTEEQRDFLKEHGEGSFAQHYGICPQCGEQLISTGGCMTCIQGCGWSKCN